MPLPRADDATPPPALTPSSRAARRRAASARARARTLRPLFARAVRDTRSTLGAALLSIVVVQGVSAAAVVPAMAWLFERALSHAGIPNVTDQTLGLLLADPLACAVLAAIVLLMFGSVWTQLALLVAIVDRRRDGRPVTIREALHDTGRAFRTAGSLQLPILVVYLLVVAPLSGLGAFSAVTEGIAVPPFVTREFMKTPLSAALYVAAFGALLYVNARLIFTVPAVLLGRLRPLSAMRLSLRMTRRRVVAVTLMLAVPALGGALLSSGVSEVIIGWAGLDSDAEGAGAAIAVGIGTALGFLLIAAAMVVAMNLVVAATRRALGRADLGPEAVAARTPRASLRNGAVAAAALSTVFVLGAASAPALAAPPASPANTVVLSHRGDVWGGVENTIGALEAAAAKHPDYVEADFQQTRDGVFVASHDTNLLMVAGVDRNIYDMDAAEVTSIVERQHGFADTIPTMAEYVTRAHELGVRLLIELKVHGHEQPGFVQGFLDELDRLGVTQDAIYHSLSPDVVSELKRLRPALSVGLTIAISVGGVPKSPCDFFVIEQASFTDAFLAEAHRQGKPVFVWTVNDDVRIRDFLRIPVDGIVTDYTEKAIDFRRELSGDGETKLAVEDALSAVSLFR